MPVQSTRTMVHREQAESSEPATTGFVKSEFSTLDRRLTSQFDSQLQFQKDVAAKTTSSIEDIHLKLSNFAKETERRFNELSSLSRNRLASRAFHHIWPLPIAKGITPPFFPRTIAMFWKLKDPNHKSQLASLLRSYQYIEFKVWGEYDNLGEPIERAQLQILPSNTSPLEHFVELYPEKAHNTLADILGLEYNNVRREMEALRRFDTRTKIKSKRENDMEEEIHHGRSSKQHRGTRSDNSSLTEEIHRGKLGDYKQTRLSSTPEGNLHASNTSSGED